MPHANSEAVHLGTRGWSHRHPYRSTERLIALDFADPGYKPPEVSVRPASGLAPDLPERDNGVLISMGIGCGTNVTWRGPQRQRAAARWYIDACRTSIGQVHVPAHHLQGRLAEDALEGEGLAPVHEVVQGLRRLPFVGRQQHL